MTTDRIPLWINGRGFLAGEAKPVFSPWSGEKVSEAVQATPVLLEEAISAADAAFRMYRKISRYTRSRLLLEMARGISERRTEFVERIVSEAGKPYVLADGEVSRAIQTFTIAAEEAKRFGGELIPVDLDAASRAFAPAVSSWVPRGPVLAINPFNFPLNLIAHKVAPALAVGTSVIVKAPPQAPGAAQLLAEVFEKAAQAVSDARDRIPLSALQVINAPNDVMSKALEDSRLVILSFTGSDQVGWALQQKAVKKKVALELGGNAAVIVHSDGNLKRAAQRCAFGGYAYAGQVCISVQRVFVQQSIYDSFVQEFAQEIRKLKVGDPSQKDVIVGPLIDQANAERVMSWIDEARTAGAQLICGGEKKDRVITPTLLSHVPSTAKLRTEEVFGPVVILDSYGNFEDAVNEVNRSRFGLQAGVFTESLKLTDYAAENLDVGGVVINEVPTYRADHLPYGGSKDSGLGREGVRYAMEEYCERRTVVTWRG